MEQKVEGLLDAYTNLENPDFARVAEAIGFHARRVEHAEDLDVAVRDWLAQPGPALLDVMTSRMELVMPPHIEAAPVFGMALYSAKAVLAGRAGAELTADKGVCAATLSHATLAQSASAAAIATRRRNPVAAFDAIRERPMVRLSA